MSEGSVGASDVAEELMWRGGEQSVDCVVGEVSV